MAGGKKRLSDQTKKSYSTNGREGRNGQHSKHSRLRKESNFRKEQTKLRKWRLSPWVFLTLIIAVLFGVLHGWHEASLFENDRFFSHLSDLEREMTFRTEMGLYYSYYKTMVNAPCMRQGLYAIMHDNITEFPSTINTLKRFNLYPEVILAAGFRFYDGITKLLGITTKQCYTVNRGRGLSPVLNCEGMGDPAYFYVNCIFMENGFLMSVLFLFGAFLSESILGGAITVAAFFFNHGECTRVQWTPPLRESFAYPVFVVQMFLVSYVLRIPKPTILHSIAISLGVVGFMLPWQFAQFALLTQTLAVFVTYMLGFTSATKVRCILQGQSIGLFVSYVMLFGNEMLLTSFFASCLLAVWVILLLENSLENIRFRVVIWMCQLCLLIGGVLVIKFVISTLLQKEDDAHIANLFRSKFLDYKDFHTMLYTCAAEFDFMQMETVTKLLKTLLLPTSVVAVVGVVAHLIRSLWHEKKEKDHSEQNGKNHQESVVHEKPPVDTVEIRHRLHGELVYHILQSAAFVVMAVLIMRLKMFLTPHLCLLSSLLASRHIFGFVKSGVHHQALVFALLGLMSVQGVLNLRHQWGIQGDFSNAPQEELLEWIKENTPPDAVFGGPMPTMASVKLSTERPIVNHPHYEDAGLRARTKLVYAMYSRKPAREVYEGYKSLGVEYAILERSWCVRRTKPGCSMPEIWDIEDSKNANKRPLCLRLEEHPTQYFTPLFNNGVYAVLQVS